MKELRKRVNGLIAILLAVCMSLEMSGGEVYAATEYSFGDSVQAYTINNIAGTVLVTGDTIKKTDSGGKFAVVLSDTSIRTHVTYQEYSYDVSDGVVAKYTTELTVKDIPEGYDGIQITEASDTGIKVDYSYTMKQLTLGWFRYPRYTLSYHGNGGTIGGNEVFDDKTTHVYYLKGTSHGYPSFDVQPQRQGYSLLGWSFKSDGKGKVYTIEDELITLPNEDITTINDGDKLTLYAVWNPYAYTVYFNSGSVGDQSATGDEMPVVRSASDQTITLPECTYTLSNYHFAGWKYMGLDPYNITSGEGIGTVYPTSSPFNHLPDTDGEIIHFNAQWEPNTVSISYDANGGTGTMAGATYTYDGSIFAYLLPGADGSLSKDGYRFIGWCENADGSSDIMPEGYQYPLDFSKGNQDITLYAIWEPNAYSIRFNGNGGTGEMANQAGISSEPTILNPNQFTSIDQMFAGWSTIGTGTVQYADRASFDYKASTNNQVVDLFAIWTKLYKLAFDANGGGGTMDTLLNGIDGIGQTLPECAFTKEGFVFKGWATNPYTLTAEYQPGDSFTYSPQTAGETVTLYAIWEAEGANAADRIQVGLGTVYLTAGQEYFFGEDGVYKVDGDPTAYPMNTIFYVPVSGNYTISVQ